MKKKGRTTGKIIYVFLFDGTFIDECIGYKEAMDKYRIKGKIDSLICYINRKSIVYGKYFFNTEKIFNPKSNYQNVHSRKTKKGYSINKDGELYLNYGNSKLIDEQDPFYFETDI